MARESQELREGGRSVLVRVFGFWSGYLIVLWMTSMLKGMAPPLWSEVVWGVSSSIAILGVTAFFLRRDRRTWGDAGLALNRTSAVRLTVGLAVGLGYFGLQLAAARMLAGPMELHVKAVGMLLPAALAIAGTFALACMEELGFRGYTLRTLERAWGTWLAQGCVAVAFGLCHLAFGWSWAAVLLGVIPSALIFGMAAVMSRGLAVPIGLHAGVNLAQASMSGASPWGFLELSMEESVRTRLESVAPISGLCVALLVFVAMAGAHAMGRGQRREAQSSSVPEGHGG